MSRHGTALQEILRPQGSPRTFGLCGSMVRENPRKSTPQRRRRLRHDAFAPRSLRSKVALAESDRKTVSRVLDTMNELGIISTTQNNRTSIHTLLCVSAWYINGQTIVNPYYVPMKDRFQEGNSSPINAHANTNGNADNTAEKPTPSGSAAAGIRSRFGSPGRSRRSRACPSRSGRWISPFTATICPKRTISRSSPTPTSRLTCKTD